MRVGREVLDDDEDADGVRALCQRLFGCRQELLTLGPQLGRRLLPTRQAGLRLLLTDLKGMVEMQQATQLLAAGLLDERTPTVNEAHQSLARIRIAGLRRRNDVDAVLDAFKALSRVAHRGIGEVDVSCAAFDLPEPINGGLIHAERLAPLVNQVVDLRGIGEPAELLGAQS